MQHLDIQHCLTWTFNTAACCFAVQGPDELPTVASGGSTPARCPTCSAMLRAEDSHVPSSCHPLEQAVSPSTTQLHKSWAMSKPSPMSEGQATGQGASCCKLTTCFSLMCSHSIMHACRSSPYQCKNICCNGHQKHRWHTTAVLNTLKPSRINCCCAEHLCTSLYSPSPCSATTVTTSPYGPNKQTAAGGHRHGQGS